MEVMITTAPTRTSRVASAALPVTKPHSFDTPSMMGRTIWGAAATSTLRMASILSFRRHDAPPYAA